MSKQEILALLDMSEREQRNFLNYNEVAWLPPESLPDLAFRLRDEVPLEKYRTTLMEVYQHQTRHPIYWEFLMYISPTEMICAALLAGLENDK